MYSCVWIKTDWNVTPIKKILLRLISVFWKQTQSSEQRAVQQRDTTPGEETGGTFWRKVMRAGEMFSVSVWCNFDPSAETNSYYRTAGIDGWELNVSWMVAKDKWRSRMPQEISEWTANCVCRQFHALAMLLKTILPIIFNVCTDRHLCVSFASLCGLFVLESMWPLSGATWWMYCLIPMPTWRWGSDGRAV